MSTNNDRSASSRKEREVKENQRKLAALLGGSNRGTAASTSNRSTTTSATKFAAPSSRKKPSTSNFKRPSSSASSVLAAARAKALARDSTTTTGTKNESSKKTPPAQTTDVTLTLKRKKPPGSTDESRSLSSLVQNVASSSSKNDDEDFSGSGTSPVTPDDFWKKIRDWDFVADLANFSSDKNKPERKPLPETFISVRHYISQWAPLCLAETRAQLMSDMLSDISQTEKKTSILSHVSVDTTSKTGKKRGRDLQSDFLDMESCYVEIKAREKQAFSSQIYSNDIFCLVPPEQKDTVELLVRGREAKLNFDSFRRAGLIGHTEVQRKSIDGLILKVSKRRWAQLGSKSMYLFRLGGNVTALREFTALCNVETLPLKRYLLGHHLQGQAKMVKQSRKISNEELLRKMGGADALGKGFTDYAKKKFNPSQLGAISASANGYGEGGVTLIKGPPGTGKTTTLVAVLNSLHIRQYNKYYAEVRRIAALRSRNRQGALDAARRSKPRLLVCAPSNAAVDNIILKIFEDGFVDGSGQRYNPSMIRVGVGQSSAVSSISLEAKVNEVLSELDLGQLDTSISGFKFELQRISGDIVKLRRRCHAIVDASPWPLGKNWEIRVDESFDQTGKCFFVNHKDQTTSFECPPPPEPGEVQFQAGAMPEYRSFMQQIVKSVEHYFSVKTNLERNMIVKTSLENGANNFMLRQSLESHLLNSVHMVMTTLGTAGNRVFEGVDRFEVVVVDEAAQSVEPATLSALRLGSRHCVLVGDPQQLPATIFNVSGRHSKYDRSLFQRLEEAGQPVHMLNQQYRMHPSISHFPRHVFYHGSLKDGPNVVKPTYGRELLHRVQGHLSIIKPFTIMDIDSAEERGGRSLSNSTEAAFAVHLHSLLVRITQGQVTQSRVAVITPYSQQVSLLRRVFREKLGKSYERLVEINTVDAFQGREANVVIFSAVRAAGSHGVGFLSDVRRMNVALTRAKHLLIVIARCESIVVNPYWKDLVEHAKASNAVINVPLINTMGKQDFADTSAWTSCLGHVVAPTNGHFAPSNTAKRPADPRKGAMNQADPRKRARLQK